MARKNESGDLRCFHECPACGKNHVHLLRDANDPHLDEWLKPCLACLAAGKGVPKITKRVSQFIPEDPEQAGESLPVEQFHIRFEREVTAGTF